MNCDPNPEIMVRQKASWTQRYRVSRKILAQSFRLIGSMRSYWVFPLLSMAVLGLFMALIMAFMLSGFASIGSSGQLPKIGNLELPMFIALMVAAFPMMLMMSLFNSALVYGFVRKLEERPVPASIAWRRAWSQLGPIFRFTVIGFFVSTIVALLGMVLEKLRFIPGIGALTQLVGALGWAAASFFVIPIIMVERYSKAVPAVKRSVSMARDHWGKSVSGIVTISLAIMIPMMLLMIPIFMVMPFLIIFVGVESVMLVVFLIIGTILVLTLLGGVVSSAGQAAYQAGLYLHATRGEIKAPFTEETLVDAWAPYREG